MTHRTITTLSNGNVQVLTHMEGVAAIELREYKQRGPWVYMLRDDGPAIPVFRELRTTGERPLKVRPCETLEDAVKHALDLRDGRRKKTLGDWIDIAMPHLKKLLARAVVVAFVLALLGVAVWLSKPPQVM